MKIKPVRDHSRQNKSVIELEDCINELHLAAAFLCGVSLHFKEGAERKPFKATHEKLRDTIDAIKGHLEEHGIHYPMVDIENPEKGSA